MTAMALVRDGKVENLIVLRPDYVAPKGCEVVPVGDAVVYIGGTYADGIFLPPEPEASAE